MYKLQRTSAGNTSVVDYSKVLNEQRVRIYLFTTRFKHRLGLAK